METLIKVHNSDRDGVYDVRIRNDRDVIKMLCNCGAADNGTFCKHRLELIKGDTSRIVDKSDINVLINMLESLQSTKTYLILLDIDRIDDEIKKMQNIKVDLKKEISSRLIKGL